MRALYLSALVLTLGFIVADIYYINEVSDARWDSYYNNVYNYDDPYGYNSYSYDYSAGESETEEAGWITMAFLVFYGVLYVMSLLLIKTTTMKVFSIIGISLTGIMMAVDFMSIANPGSMSYDEVGPVFIIFAVAMLAFGIVGTVHAFKKAV
jgi:hypothetical protein